MGRTSRLGLHSAVSFLVLPFLNVYIYIYIYIYIQIVQFVQLYNLYFCSACLCIEHSRDSVKYYSHLRFFVHIYIYIYIYICM